MDRSLVVFRVDASLQMGSGHVMRCMTLASKLRDKGARCIFVSRPQPGDLISFIKELQFEILTLDPSTRENVGSHWLSVEQKYDVQQTISVLSGHKPNWVVIDNYGIDEEWEKRIRDITHNVMVIDDLADRTHDCDLLLDQTFGRTSNDYAEHVSSNRKILCGAKYSLLRAEFAMHREMSLARRCEPDFKHMLISLGSVDYDNISEKALYSLKTCSLPDDFKISVIIGQNNPHFNSLKEMASTLPFSVDVLVNPDNIASLMSNADVSIGAAGTTSWERCCLGLPSIVVVLADNQRTIARNLEEVGAAKVIDLGNMATKLPATISFFQDDPIELRKMADCAQNITDGLGADIVAAEIFGR